jgi:ankyrin repeat protein
LQSEILPHATKEPENSLFHKNISNALIPDNIFSSMPDQIHLPESLQTSLSVHLKSRAFLPGLNSQQNDINHSQSHAFSSGAQLAASFSTTNWQRPLHIAAEKGYGDIVELLLEHNTDCNEKDSDSATPLAHAIRGGHEAAVGSTTLTAQAARFSIALLSIVMR